MEENETKAKRSREEEQEDNEDQDTANQPSRSKSAFIYGNYDSYYGYRNNNDDDPRLALFDKSNFHGKYVLDIGCNTGIPTLAIAKTLEPKLIIGVDIDQNLVRRAKKNIGFQYSLIEPKEHYEARPEPRPPRQFDYFPISFPISLGTIPWERPVELNLDNCGPFPNNVRFVAMDYVNNDDTPHFQRGFDTILALSITKWIQLNWGDDGIKTLFSKINDSLNPGGVFFLEAQPFNTYKQRARMNSTLKKNYQSVKLRPEQFSEYLNSIGFTGPETLGTPQTVKKGFQRSLLMFTKP